MHDFHARLGITPHRGRWKNEDGRRYMRWRFANLTTGQKFARQFGGSLVTGRYAGLLRYRECDVRIP
jgi:hypothetical protein